MYFDPQPSLNGHNGPSKANLNAQPPKPRASVFLKHLPVSSWHSFLHHLAVAHFASVSLLRLITLLWIAIILLGLIGSYPGGNLIGVLLLIGLVAFYVHFYMQRRTDFVDFQPAKGTTPAPLSLPVEDKIAIYVTGECAVEGKQRRFTCLPGFYRTFATREHALLCQVKERRIFGLAAWNGAEIGLWYVFFYPATIRKIQTGLLTYGRETIPTVAVEYLVTRTFKKSGEPDRTEVQTILISTPDAADLHTVLADLLVDAPLDQPQQTSQSIANG